GVLAVQAADAGARGDAPAGPAAAHRRGLLEVVARHGGGPLAVAIRRDPTGAAVRLLETAVWLPDLGSALAVQKDLPGGWIAVTRDGTAVIGSISVNLGRSDGPLERRAEEARLAAEHARLESEAAGPRRAAEESHAAVEGAREAVAGARGAEVSAVAARNQLEAAQRVAGREAEAAARELAWQGAQEDRLVAEADRLADVLGSLESDATSPGAEGAPPAADSGSAEDANIGTALHAWGARSHRRGWPGPGGSHGTGGSPRAGQHPRAGPGGACRPRRARPAGTSRTGRFQIEGRGHEPRRRPRGRRAASACRSR